MLDGIFARVGIGAATVDTQIRPTTVIPGDTLQGEVIVQGGKVPQEVNALYLRLMTRYRTDESIRTFVLASRTLSAPMTIEPEQTWRQAFNLDVPYYTPLTIGHTPVYVVTGLDIALSVDPQDTDKLRVNPHPLQSRVLQALEELGFHLRREETEYHGHWGHYGSPLIQELEFHPPAVYRHRMTELEVVFRLDAAHLDVYLEIDRRARGLGLLFESLNERYEQMRFTNADLQRGDWAARIDAAIRKRL